MEPSALIPSLMLIALIGAGVCLLIPNSRAVLRFTAVVTLAILGTSLMLAFDTVADGPGAARDAVLRVDALSAYYLVIMALVFAASSIFAIGYFEPAIREKKVTHKSMQRFAALWLCSLSAMALVLTSNNMGLMWVGMEATTVSTAFLISLHSGGHELEAMWKYLIVCSVGIAFAFMGTLLCAAAVPGDATGGGANALLWTHLMDVRTQLNPALMRTAFVFLLVGYGTKAGLAPMHTWLPDAHSQAPAPVSAMFSGFMLNAALYCIVRYLPIVDGAVPGFGTGLLLLFGIISILLAAAFIMFQTDAKRLLAYSSVEHLGIIAIGFGLGPLGTQAALFHSLNHSVCKSLGFYSVGRLGQSYGSHDMSKIRGALHSQPVWGVGLLGSLLALIGVAPFAVFMSEFQTLHAAVDRNAWVALTLFIGALSVIFIVALRRAIDMSFGRPAASALKGTRSWSGLLLVGGGLGLMLAVGLWMPDSLRNILNLAEAALGGAS